MASFETKCMCEEIEKFFAVASVRAIRGLKTEMFSRYLNRRFGANYMPGQYAFTLENGEGVINWYRDYELKFHNTLHPVWFMNESGGFRFEDYDQYIKGFDFSTKWFWLAQGS